MKSKFLVCIFILASKISVGQNDTVYHYYEKAGREVPRDSAFTTFALVQKNGKWHGIVYYKSGKIRSEGDYTASDAKTPHGSFKNFNESGTLENIREWENGKTTEINYFYKNGSKKSWIKYPEKGSSEQKGWDETGKEIKNFVVEREAMFKGGLEGWKRYLEKNLNANVAADAGAPVGDYTVKVQFVVSKEGYVSKVKAVEVPDGCKPCAAEAVSVISLGPTWEHAIQNNEPVIYQAIQYITFQVSEGKGKRKN